MKKGLTEIIFILDRSGSMSGLESDTIGGFNSMMKKQKQDESEAIVSTILFDNTSKVLYDRISINQVPQMTDQDYYVRGCTALLDAVGGAIHHIRNVHKYAREEDRPEKTLFVITTDGMENASRNYDYEKVKQMIKHQKKKYGWEFIFIGANIDSIEVAGRFGIDSNRAVDYVHDELGTQNVYASVNKAVHVMRSAPLAYCDKMLSNCGWDEEIRSDYKKRSSSREDEE